MHTSNPTMTRSTTQTAYANNKKRMQRDGWHFVAVWVRKDRWKAFRKLGPRVGFLKSSDHLRALVDEKLERHGAMPAIEPVTTSVSYGLREPGASGALPFTTQNEERP